MARGTTRRTIRVSDELWLAAQTRADERKESLSDVIRRALEQYTNSEGEPDHPDQH